MALHAHLLGLQLVQAWLYVCPRERPVLSDSARLAPGQGRWSPLTTNRCHWSRALSLSSWAGLVVKLRSWAWLQKGRRPQTYGTHWGLSSFRELECR